MSDAYRTVDNPGTGETITFVETSEASGGARVVALITLAPGGAITPHSHQVKETFECIEGTFTIHLADRDMTFPAGASLAVGPHQLHGFRNDTDVPATLKVTATPAGDLDRVLRTLSGLSGTACSSRASPRGIHWPWRTWPTAAATTPRRCRAGSTGH